MKHIRHLFFDLDHTLWDYDTNARAVLKDIYARYRLSEVLQVTDEVFAATFFKTNDELWYAYHLGKIDKDAIRKERFSKIFRICGGRDERLCAEIGAYYLFACPQQPAVMPDALMTLDYLSKRYSLSIITNGFDDVQSIKLRASGLDKFFGQVFTSETIGYKKPAKEIFEHALKVVNATCSEALMIGDNPHTDILGARNAGITSILYNPTGKTRSDCEFQISHLPELITFL